MSIRMTCYSGVIHRKKCFNNVKCLVESNRGHPSGKLVNFAAKVVNCALIFLCSRKVRFLARHVYRPRPRKEKRSRIRVRLLELPTRPT